MVLRVIHICFLFILILASCKSFRQDFNKFSSIELGVIGEKSGAFGNHFNTKAIPELQQEVRLSVQSFKVKDKYPSLLDSTQVSRKRDSIDPPHYFKIAIANMSSLIDQLNADVNQDLHTYIQQNSGLKVVTDIAIYFPKELEEQLLHAQAIYLRQTGNALYKLKIISNNNSSQLLGFDLGKILSFKTSKFCWQRNHQGTLKIVEITTGGCPGNSKPKASSVEKKKDIFDKL